METCWVRNLCWRWGRNVLSPYHVLTLRNKRAESVPCNDAEMETCWVRTLCWRWEVDALLWWFIFVANHFGSLLNHGAEQTVGNRWLFCAINNGQSLVIARGCHCEAYRNYEEQLYYLIMRTRICANSDFLKLQYHCFSMSSIISYYCSIILSWCILKIMKNRDTNKY